MCLATVSDISIKDRGITRLEGSRNCQPPCQMSRLNAAKPLLSEWEITHGDLQPSHPNGNLRGARMSLAHKSKSKSDKDLKEANIRIKN